MSIQTRAAALAVDATNAIADAASDRYPRATNAIAALQQRAIAWLLGAAGVAPALPPLLCNTPNRGAATLARVRAALPAVPATIAEDFDACYWGCGHGWPLPAPHSCADTIAAYNAAKAVASGRPLA